MTTHEIELIEILIDLKITARRPVGASGVPLVDVMRLQTEIDLIKEKLTTNDDELQSL